MLGGRSCVIVWSMSIASVGPVREAAGKSVRRLAARDVGGSAGACDVEGIAATGSVCVSRASRSDAFATRVGLGAALVAETRSSARCCTLGATGSAGTATGPKRAADVLTARESSLRSQLGRWGTGGGTRRRVEPCWLSTSATAIGTSRIGRCAASATECSALLELFSTRRGGGCTTWSRGGGGGGAARRRLRRTGCSGVDSPEAWLVGGK